MKGKGMEDRSIKGISPLILALDTGDLMQGVKIARSVRDHVKIVKVGLQLFSARGPSAVKALKEEGFEVFLDIKMMDIPNTVAAACRELCGLEPLMLTIQTMGGQEMMRAASAAVDEHCSGAGVRRPYLIGVTVLTSFDLFALKKTGVRNSVEAQVLMLARLAESSGMDGLVASPLETIHVRRQVGEEMIIITPGIRLPGMEPDDQKRVASPGEAVRAGADFLVVGRPLCQASDPKAVAEEMLADAGRL